MKNVYEEVDENLKLQGKIIRWQWCWRFNKIKEITKINKERR